MEGCGLARWLVSLLCVAVSCLLCLPVDAQRALMSVDLGGEFMKIAIVKPGVPMEIVLNKESSRKTRSIVAFRDGERHFANEAYSTGVRFPDKSFWFLSHVIGRQYDDPMVEQFRERFPHYREVMVRDEERGTVLFKDTSGTVYSSEELLGMMLEKAREYAQDFAEQKIQDAVITIPPYYTQAERRAVLAAAELVGLNILQLMTDTAAVALNYGVFRRKNFNTSTQYYMFYDMGATSTVVSVVGYKMVKSQVGSRVESNPQLTVKGVGYDRNLGGLEMTLRLRDHLAKAFDAQKKRPIRVRDNARAMAKLLKEAERVKKVLSANSDHRAQVEGLLEGEDFSHKVTRAQYLELIKDLLDRVTLPVDEALRSSEITWPEINEVILMGGGSRLPRVHELLLAHSGKQELGKSVNTDEAAALGAVYQAAYLGTGFKVKTFHVRDANLFPINVEFDKQKAEEEGEETSSGPKRIKRTLFGRTNYYPQKKVMTFNKHYVKDFNFDIRYGELDFLSEEEKRLFSSLWLSRVNLKGVETAFSRRGATAASLYKGVKVHFRMDESGLLHLDLVESAFEEDPATKEGGSYMSKLGSAIGSMFGGQEEGEGQQQKTDDTPSSGDGTAEWKKAEGETGEQGKTEDKHKTAQEEKKKKEKEKKEKEKKKKADKSKESNKGADSGRGPRALQEKLKAVVKLRDLSDLSKDKVRQAKKRLSDWRRRDEEKEAVEKAKNELEGFIVDTQDQLLTQGSSLQQCSTQQERSAILHTLSQAADWLYQQPDSAKTAVFTNKRKELKKSLLKRVETRVREREERPKALKALRKTLQTSAAFLQEARLNHHPPPAAAVYTNTDIFRLDRLINETKAWQKEAEEEQKKRGDRADPAVLVDTIHSKVKALDREVKYLQNKAKNPKAPSSSSSSPSSSSSKKRAKANKTGSDDDGDDEKKEEKKEEEEERKEEERKKREEDEDAVVEEETDEEFNTAGHSSSSSSSNGEGKTKSGSHTDSSHIEL